MHTHLLHSFLQNSKHAAKMKEYAALYDTNGSKHIAWWKRYIHELGSELICEVGILRVHYMVCDRLFPTKKGHQ